MVLIMTEVSIFVILLFIIECGAQESTVKTMIIETTTEFITIITDIPEEDVEKALNQGYGRYTTQSFLYDNHQYHKGYNGQFERCYDDMIKCNLAVVVPVPVCVYNNPSDTREGYRIFLTYCDAYFDSCIRKMRFWRILDFGRCIMNHKAKELHSIINTRKMYGKSFRELYKFITSNKEQNNVE